MKNEHYFILALKLLYLTLRSNTNKKHAAAIIKNNRLFYRRSNFTGMHAEQNVLRQMETKEKVMLVIRCEKNILKYSKPCKFCIELMKKKGIKPKNVNEDLRNWFKEKWVDVSRKVDGKHPPCGRKDADGKSYPKCRPSKKVSSETPKIASSYDKEDKKKMTQQKRRAEKKDPKIGTGNKPTMTHYKKK
jgi:hypothetical protein